MPQITATSALPSAGDGIGHSGRVDGAGLTASIPPDASRFAANVVRMLCSASGPSGSSNAAGLDPDVGR